MSSAWGICVTWAFTFPWTVALTLKSKESHASMEYSVQIAFLPLAELLLLGESLLGTQCYHCAIWKQSLLGGGAATLLGRSQVHICSLFQLTSSVPTKEERTMLCLCLCRVSVQWNLGSHGSRPWGVVNSSHGLCLWLVLLTVSFISSPQR